MYEFDITLNDNDYMLYNEYHLFHSAMGKRNLNYIKLSIPILSFMIGFLVDIYNTDFLVKLLSSILITLIASILWLCFGKKLLLLLMKLTIKDLNKAGILPYSKESIIKFDDVKIHEITENTDTKTKYTSIKNIFESEEAIYIYVNTIQAYIIPLTIFSNEIEKQEFLEFIHVKAGI